VFLAILLDLIGFGILLPLIPFYAQRLHASNLAVGALFSAYSVAQLLCAPSLGRLSDRYGRRPLMLASIAAGIVANALFAWGDSLPVLLAARLLAGAAAANYGIAQAYVADVTRDSDRSRAMGLVGAAFGIGFVLGPAFGALLARYGLTAVPATAAALSAVNLIIAAISLKESLPPEHRHTVTSEGQATVWRQLWADPSLRAVMLLFFLVMFGFSIMEATLALYCQSRGFTDSDTAWLFTYVGLVLAGVQGGLIGLLARRFGDRRLILAGILLMAAGLVALPLHGSWLWLLATLLLLAVGSAIHNPSLSALLSRLAQRARQGETIGVSRSCGALARATGPVAGTWIFGFGTRWPFWTAGALLLVAFVFARDLFRRVAI
jgi:DHA1 family tetracycline resistance protein-like MFS transporter